MADPISCLRTSAIIIAIWFIIFSLIQMGLMGWQLQVVKDRVSWYENRNTLPATGAIDPFQARFPGLYQIYTETPDRRRTNALYVMVIVNTIISILLLLFSISLLYGAIKLKRFFIFPWFFVIVPSMIMSTAYAVTWWAGDIFNEQLTFSVAEFVVALPLNGVLFVIIIFFYARLVGSLTSDKPASRKGRKTKTRRRDYQRYPKGTYKEEIHELPPWRTEWPERAPKELEKKIRRKRRKEERDARIYQQAYCGEVDHRPPAPYEPTFPWVQEVPRPPSAGAPKRKRSAAEIIENLYYEHYPDEVPNKVGELRRERPRVQGTNRV